MIKIRSLKVIGLSQPEIEKKLKNILKDKHLTLNRIELSTDELETIIKIGVQGKDEDEIILALETWEGKIRNLLEDYIFGIDEETLEKVVGVMLSMRKKTIAIAESCTGGLLSNRLTDIPGSSSYFQGSMVTYSNEFKINLLNVLPETIEKFGAVSQETATAMAEGIKKLSHADLGLAITGIAGPGGMTRKKPLGLIYMALAAGDEIILQKHQFSGNRATIKLKASQAALDMVRRYLLKG